MKIKVILLCTIFLISGKVFSMVETKKILSPRGLEVEVTVHSSTNSKKPTIIVAPGQNCNSKGPIFETLGAHGLSENFTVVRFEWAYCLIDPKKPVPSEDLSAEVEDFNTVLEYAKSLPSVDADKIIIAGKSLGSVVAFSIFQTNKLAKGLVLLTPLCSYIGDDNKPVDTCEEYYPGLKKDIRPIFMAFGDEDNACISSILFNYLKDANRNIFVTTAGGDHGFRVKGTDGKLDETKTQNNISSVIKAVLNWASLKI